MIRCTVMFGNERERDGKVQVPVEFSVNGRRIVPIEGANEPYIDYSHDKPLYPYIAFKQPNSVLAKVKIMVTTHLIHNSTSEKELYSPRNSPS